MELMTALNDLDQVVGVVEEKRQECHSFSLSDAASLPQSVSTPAQVGKGSVDGFGTLNRECH